MKQRRESIDVAEILSLVPQLEEKYREKRKRKPSRGSLCLVLQLEKRTITDGPSNTERKLREEKEKVFRRTIMFSVAVRGEVQIAHEIPKGKSEKRKRPLWCCS